MDLSGARGRLALRRWTQDGLARRGDNMAAIGEAGDSEVLAHARPEED